MFYYFFTPIVVFKIARFCQRKIFKQNLGFENVRKRFSTKRFKVFFKMTATLSILPKILRFLKNMKMVFLVQFYYLSAKLL